MVESQGFYSYKIGIIKRRFHGALSYLVYEIRAFLGWFLFSGVIWNVRNTVILEFFSKKQCASSERRMQSYPNDGPIGAQMVFG